MDESGMYGNLSDASAGLYGFYKSAEGRQFLKSLYRQWLRRDGDSIGKRKFGGKKIASMVAVDRRMDQELENEQTRKALGRWAFENQSEVWRGDKHRTEQVMRRLEIQFMLEPELAQCCHDRASSTRRQDVAHALSYFARPPLNGVSNFSSMNRIRNFAGLYEILYENTRPRDEFASFDSGTYCRFWAAEDASFLIMQQVALEEKLRHRDDHIYTRTVCGFAYMPSPNHIIRFVVDYRNPQCRWIERMVIEDHHSPKESDRDYIKMLNDEGLKDTGGFRATDILCHSFSFSLNDTSMDYISNQEVKHYRYRVLRRLQGDKAKFIDAYFSSVQWDIPL